MSRRFTCPAEGAVALGRDLFPDRHLALAVDGDGEGLQHFKVDLVGAVGVQQLGRGVAEAQTLLDDALGRAEAGGDGGDRLAGRDQLGEGDHLVGGVHGDADDVLGERNLAGLCVAGPDLAGHRMAGIEHLVLVTVPSGRGGSHPPDWTSIPTTTVTMRF